MANKGYNYEFKMMMEGVEVPFYNATIISTPNGVEASISVYESSLAYELKPKTSVQILYRDWMKFKGEPSGKRLWRILFDGSLSKFYKIDQSKSARALSLVCRDFRSDIRKVPSSLIYSGGSELGVHDTETVGLKHDYTLLDGSANGSAVSASSRNFNGGPINDIWTLLLKIAGSAAGLGGHRDLYSVNGYKAVTADLMAAIKSGDKSSKTDYGFILDSIARGLWAESKAASTMAAYLHTRIRADKRIFIPRNEAGSYIFNKQAGGISNAGGQIGSMIMGNSTYSSVESVILTLSSLFSMRPYACSTPSVISMSPPSSPDKRANLMNKVVDQRVNDFIKKINPDDSSYMLNQLMLLPPLEFTAPPDCNIFFPCMYDHIEWDHDYDLDYTRARFIMPDIIGNSSSSVLGIRSQSLPNTLSGTNGTFLTEEERYKGVSLLTGEINQELVKDDATTSMINSTFGASSAVEAQNLIDTLRAEHPDLLSAANGDIKIDSTKMSPVELTMMKKLQDISKGIRAKRQATGDNSQAGDAEKQAALHHGAIKFFNARFNGRACNMQMAFNPFIMAGFPGCAIAGSNALGVEGSKSVIGMVQQVKHMISIQPNAAEAVTSLVMNNTRFEDEPTDMSDDGAPLYMKATEPESAKIDDTELLQSVTYFPPDPQGGSISPSIEKNKIYGVELNPKKSSEYKFAKDLVTLSDAESRVVTNRIHLDAMYEPTKIHRFYMKTLGVSNGFMIGNSKGGKPGNSSINFIYDTMHEALRSLVDNNKDKILDYEWAMNRVYRRVVNIDEFYIGILNLSKKINGSYSGQWNDTETVVTGEGPGGNLFRYYGVSQEKYDGNKKFYDDRKIKPGGFSSIGEREPVTALTLERREAVEKYAKEAMRFEKIL